MRFIVDAQLPQLLAARLTSLGHDAVHVKSLPGGGDTSDAELAAFADREARIVVTKDVDFANSHLLSGTPRRLLHVRTGNIKNTDLLALFVQFIRPIEHAFVESDHVDLHTSALVVHPRSPEL